MIYVLNMMSVFMRILNMLNKNGGENDFKLIKLTIICVTICVMAIIILDTAIICYMIYNNKKIHDNIQINNKNDGGKKQKSL